MIKEMREKGYVGKLNRRIIYYERDILSITWKYLCGDKKIREQIDQRRAKKDGVFLGIDCLLQEGITTWEAVEDKLRELSPSQPESEMQSNALQEPVDTDAAEEALHEITATRPPQKETSAIRRPFDLLASAIQDVAKVAEHLYQNTVEGMQETIIELQRRLDGAEKENRSLKQNLGNHEQRLAEVEDLLTANPAQLAAVQKTTQRLKRDVVIGLPTQTKIDGYWKETHSVVYRKRFNRFLHDKGLQPEEKDALITVVGQIMIDPFVRALGTETRWNGDGGEVIAGIENKETYYYTHVTYQIRVRWILREEEKRIHFIDTFRKTTRRA